MKSSLMIYKIVLNYVLIMDKLCINYDLGYVYVYLISVKNMQKMVQYHYY